MEKEGEEEKKSEQNEKESQKPCSVLEGSQHSNAALLAGLLTLAIPFHFFHFHISFEGPSL